MDEGFALLDAAPLTTLTGKRQYFLFRVPLEVSFDELQGVRLDTLSAVKEIRSTQDGGRKLRVLREKQDSSSCAALRSLAVSEVDGGVCVQSAAFSASFTLHPVMPVPRMPASASASGGASSSGAGAPLGRNP
eukprot:gene26960-32574_t